METKDHHQISQKATVQEDEFLKIKAPLLIGEKSSFSRGAEKAEIFPISREVAMTTTNKPWLNDDGSHKSDEEIKQECSRWGPTVWEEYLQTLEHDEEGEEFLFDEAIECENYSIEEHTDFFQDLFSNREFPVLKNRLICLLRELTPKQQKVIKLIYWEDKKLREVAEVMNCGTSAVFDLRDRALKKLGKHFLKNIVPIESAPSKKTTEKAENLPISMEMA